MMTVETILMKSKIVRSVDLSSFNARTATVSVKRLIAMDKMIVGITPTNQKIVHALSILVMIRLVYVSGRFS